MAILDIALFQELLKNHKSTFICVHHRPDGDSLASALALATIFEKKGQPVKIISPTSYDANFSWMSGASQIEIFHEKDLTKWKNKLQSMCRLICVDFSHLKQAGQLAPLFEQSSAEKYIIDHHQDPQNFGTLLAWDTKASSTTLLIQRLLNKLELQSLYQQNIDLATALYVGILTDTGFFQHDNVTSETHQFAAQLIDAGVQPKAIFQKIFSNENIRRLKFIGHCLHYRLKHLLNKHFAYIAIPKEDVLHFQLQAGDTCGLAQHAMSLKNVKACAILMDHGDHIRISFRSVADLAINEIAMKHFQGGGHKNAAGGVSYKSLDNTVKDVVKLFS